MHKLFHAAWIWMAVGLLSGLFYREFTKANDFTHGMSTQLAVVHTHTLALGMMMMLVILALAAVLPKLAEQSMFRMFFWFYNAGLAVTVAMMTTRGILQVRGNEADLPAISGISGMGHILLTIGLIQLFVALGKSLPSRTAAQAGTSAG